MLEKSKSKNSKLVKFLSSSSCKSCKVSQRFTESASVAVVCMYWMIHCIKWSLKKKIKNDISKEEKFKSETQIKIISQKILEKSPSVQTDHRVSNNSSNACMTHWIEWSLKMKIKNQISKVEKLKSENRNKNDYW